MIDTAKMSEADRAIVVKAEAAIDSTYKRENTVGDGRAWRALAGEVAGVAMRLPGKNGKVKRSVSDLVTRVNTIAGMVEFQEVHRG